VPGLIRGAAADAGILQRQLRGTREQQRRPVEVPDALRADERTGRELGDLSRRSARAGGEERQRAQPGGACHEAVPERLASGTERRDDTDPGDDDALHRHPSNLRSTTQLLFPPKAIALLSATESGRLRAVLGT